MTGGNNTTKTRLQLAPLYVAALGHLVIEFSNNYLPVLYPVLIPRMGLNYTQVGIITLVAITAVSLAQPLFGWLSDKWGPARLCAGSIVWIGIMMGLVGFATNYTLLIVLIALGSLGSAAFHPPSAVIAASHSGSHRGAGISVFSVGGNIGSALSPLWIALAIGWFGLHGTATLIPVGVVFGAIAYVQLRRLSLAGRPAAHKDAPAAAGFLAGVVLIVIGMMFRSWYQVSLTTYLPVWIDAEGGSVAAGGSTLSVYLFAISIGSLVGGPAGDRFGYWQTILFGIALLIVSHGLFMRTTGYAQLLTLATIGIATGSTYPTSIVLMLQAWPNRVGFASGLLMGLGWWPGGIGASVTGLLADRWTLTASLEWLIAAPVLTLSCFVVYAVLSRRQSPEPARAA